MWVRYVCEKEVVLTSSLLAKAFRLMGSSTMEARGGGTRGADCGVGACNRGCGEGAHEAGCGEGVCDTGSGEGMRETVGGDGDSDAELEFGEGMRGG